MSGEKGGGGIDRQRHINQKRGETTRKRRNEKRKNQTRDLVINVVVDRFVGTDKRLFEDLGDDAIDLLTQDVEAIEFFEIDGAHDLAHLRHHHVGALKAGRAQQLDVLLDERFKGTIRDKER